MKSNFYSDEVLSGRTPVDVVASTPRSLAFRHTRPSYPVHIVVIPRKHIRSLTSVTDDDAEDFQDLMDLVRAVARDVERDHGRCKVTTNLGSYQDSDHLHWHVYVTQTT